MSAWAPTSRGYPTPRWAWKTPAGWSPSPMSSSAAATRRRTSARSWAVISSGFSRRSKKQRSADYGRGRASDSLSFAEDHGQQGHPDVESVLHLAEVGGPRIVIELQGDLGDSGQGVHDDHFFLGGLHDLGGDDVGRL